MAITSGQKAVVACTGCSAILPAEVLEGDSFTPMGSADECACGASTFRRLR